MSVKPRTIDDLGIDSSIRYAKDQEALDARLIQESRFIPQKTEVAVIKPYVPTEFEQFASIGKAAVWASFAPPPEYFVQGRTLFTFQLIPSLGGAEKQQADTDKLEGLEDALSKPFKEGGEQDQAEQDQEEKERQVLIALMKCIGLLDKALILINSRRNQYQRG